MKVGRHMGLILISQFLRSCVGLDQGRFFQIGECVREQGFEVEVKDAGSQVSYEHILGIELAIWQCEAMYPSLWLDLPTSDETMMVLYEYLTQYLIPCAEDHGVKFAMEPPTMQAYSDAWQGPLGANPAGEWTPNIIGGKTWASETVQYFNSHEDEYKKLFGDCPAYPPQEYMLGIK